MNLYECFVFLSWQNGQVKKDDEGFITLKINSQSSVKQVDQKLTFKGGHQICDDGGISAGDYQNFKMSEVIRFTDFCIMVEWAKSNVLILANSEFLVEALASAVEKKEVPDDS